MTPPASPRHVNDGHLCTFLPCKVENARQRVPSVAKGTGAARSLTSLSQPAIDWVALASGMGVPGRAAATAEEFAECMRQGLVTDGPFLIHARLA